jgi:hypothetical protein
MDEIANRCEGCIIRLVTQNFDPEAEGPIDSGKGVREVDFNRWRVAVARERLEPAHVVDGDH